MTRVFCVRSKAAQQRNISCRRPFIDLNAFIAFSVDVWLLCMPKTSSSLQVSRKKDKLRKKKCQASARATFSDETNTPRLAYDLGRQEFSYSRRPTHRRVERVRWVPATFLPLAIARSKTAYTVEFRNAPPFGQVIQTIGQSSKVCQTPQLTSKQTSRRYLNRRVSSSPSSALLQHL